VASNLSVFFRCGAGGGGGDDVDPGGVDDEAGGDETLEVVGQQLEAAAVAATLDRRLKQPTDSELLY
jgi:hypothetical protein